MPTRYTTSAKNKYPSIEAFLRRTPDKKESRKLVDELYHLRSLCSRHTREKGLPILYPNGSEIEQLWADYREYTEDPRSGAPEARAYIRSHRETLEKLYPPTTASFLVYWYEIWGYAHLELEIPVEDADYKWFFTLKQEGIPFFPEGLYYYRIIKTWFSLRSTEVRKLLLRDLMKDPDFLKKCEEGNYRPPPGSFPLEARDVFQAYSNSLIQDRKTNKEKRFALVDKIVQEEGISIEEAFSRIP